MDRTRPVASALLRNWTLTGTALALLATASLAEVRVERASSTGLTVRWSADGEARRERIALPPGGDVAVSRVRDGDGVEVDLSGLSEGLLGEPGWFRHVRFRELRLDPAALPAGIVGPLRLELAYRGGQAAPPRSLSPDEADLVALFRRSGFLDADVALAAHRAAAADVRLRPPFDGARAPGRLRLEGRTRPTGLGPVGSDPGRRFPGSGGPGPVLSGFDGGRVKILVERSGIYRITHAQLAASGADLASVPVETLHLSSPRPEGGSFDPANANRDDPVPIHVVDANADGTFNAGDYFEFWGQALTNDFRTRFFQGDDTTDVNAYWLNQLPNAPRMASVDATPNAGSPDAVDFLDTAHAEQDSIFYGNHLTGQDDVDHYYWCPSLIWAGGNEATRTELVPLPGVNPSSTRAAALRLRALSRTSSAALDPDHRSLVNLAGTEVSAVDGDGFSVVDHDVTGLSAAPLTDPVDVTFRAPGLPGMPSNRFELNWIEIDYPRSFQAVDDRLEFTHETGFTVEVSGLSTSDVTALDISSPEQPRRLTGIVTGPGTVRLEVGGLFSSRVAVIAHAPVPAFVPKEIAWVPDTGLRSPSQAADFVVIGPRSFLDPPSATLSAYVADRQVQGLAVELVAFEDIVDEFSYGIFRPNALVHFFNAIVSTWSTAPRWALLLGDATLDHKDRLGSVVRNPSNCDPAADPCGYDELGWTQHVPVLVIDNPADNMFLGYYASDVAQVILPGDWVPDVALGRLPARDRSELDALLTKILDYEALSAAPPAWASNVIHVADQFKVPAERLFERVQDDAFADSIAPHYTRSTFYYETDYGATNPDQMTMDLHGAWSTPALSGAILSYIGHGSAFRWSDFEFLTNRQVAPSCRNDVGDLSGPGTPAPVVVNANCITGAFMHLLGPSALEELVRQPEGGAIAAYGPTGVTFASAADDIVLNFFENTHGRDGRGLRLGDAILGVQAQLALLAAVGAPQELLSNVLLGDPTLRLVVPVGPAALTLRGTPGDMFNDLDWDAVPGADSYTLHRSVDTPDGPWIEVATGLVGTMHQDAGLDNGRQYYYALEPVAGGWPGRWSNRVELRPCGPGVPAPPTNLNVSNRNCVAVQSILMTWSPSATPNLQGYRVRVFSGTTPSGTPEQDFVIPGTIAFLADLEPYRDYSVTVASLTWCNVEGAETPAPLSVAPCGPAVDRPAFIPDLMVARSGAADLDLAWSPVTKTIRGEPLTPTGYVVHRFVRPDSLADLTTEIGSPPGPAFSAAGRVGNGEALEFFTVVAVGPSGDRGSVGHRPPREVTGLTSMDVSPTDRRISWSPVLEDMDFLTTAVDRYHVHASPTPLTRAMVEGRMPDATVTGATEVDLPIALGDFYFVVAEDVHGNRSLN